jgi:hypothetical protein
VFILSEMFLAVVFLHSMLQLLVTADVVPSSLILVTLMMETKHSSETLVPTRVTQRNIPEDGILHVQCLFKLYICLRICLQCMYFYMMKNYFGIHANITHSGYSQSLY